MCIYGSIAGMFEGFNLDDRQFEVDNDEMLNTVATLPDRSLALVPRTAVWTDPEGKVWLNPDALVCDKKMSDLYYQKPSELTETLTKYIDDDMLDLVKVDGKLILIDNFGDEELIVPETRTYFGLPINDIISDNERESEFFDFIEKHYEISDSHSELESLTLVFNEIFEKVDSYIRSYEATSED